MSSREELLYAIATYLQSLAKDDSKQVAAVESLQNAFAIDTSVDAFSALSHYPLSLEDIFASGVAAQQSSVYASRLQECESTPKFSAFIAAVTDAKAFDGAEPGTVEYLERYAKCVTKFKTKMGAKAKGGAADEAAAEEKKNAGNACISKKDYSGAVQAYSEALVISPEGPSSHMFLTNRAAAYCYLKQYQNAIDDCAAATALCPTYAKAYSRMGLANFFLENYEGAVAAYSKCVELEPENNASKESLKQAEAKLEERQVRQAPSSSQGGGGMPDLASLMGGGGMPGGLEALMQNPMMMQMAQEMMQNPAMMQQAMQMMGGGGGGGGAPNMAAIAEMMKGMKK
jgi:small glutamine-rich tetratricopeptide repeat-containing protein alpha